MTTTTSVLPTGDLTADVLDGVPPDVYRRRWVILGVLCTSLMIVVIGNTSLNVALPTMSEALGLTNSQQQWVVDAYSLIFAGMLFTAGTLGDRFGRKGFMQAGIVIFGAACAYATFFADSAGELIAARALMGVGGALVMPATLSHPRQQLPVARAGQGHRHLERASPAAAARSASCSAAGSSRTSGGARRSPSTCP